MINNPKKPIDYPLAPTEVEIFVNSLVPKDGTVHKIVADGGSNVY